MVEWQTRYFEVVVRQLVWVQVPLSAPQMHSWTNGKPWVALHTNLRGKSSPFKGENPVFDSGAVDKYAILNRRGFIWRVYILTTLQKARGWLTLKPWICVSGGMADALVLGTSVLAACGFESHLAYH